MWVQTQFTQERCWTLAAKLVNILARTYRSHWQVASRSKLHHVLLVAKNVDSDWPSAPPVTQIRWWECVTGDIHGVQERQHPVEWEQSVQCGMRCWKLNQLKQMQGETGLRISHCAQWPAESVRKSAVDSSVELENVLTSPNTTVTFAVLAFRAPEKGGLRGQCGSTQCVRTQQYCQGVGLVWCWCGW